LPVWFINLEVTKESIFLAYSKLCGEFSCVRYWVRGMLSNYFSISKSIKKYGSKKMVYKSSIFLKIMSNWYITRYTWPRAIFVASISSNYIVCCEAASMLLPIIGVIDSNIKSFLVKFPIASNDDSLESFYYILNIVSRLILLLKYRKLVIWFSKYKKVAKEISLKKLINYWHSSKKSSLEKMFRPLNLFNELGANLSKIESFYKEGGGAGFSSLFSRGNIAYFDYKLISKRFFFKKYNKLLLYKRKYLFNNELRMRVSNNIKATLSSLVKKKKFNRHFIKKYKSIIKYSALYWASFVYSIKGLRIIYNTFNVNKKNFKFLNLKFFQNFKKLRYKFKFFYFPFFFFLKKKSVFYKTNLSNHTSFSNRLKNILFFSKKRFLKFFVELYYNKWFIFLLNSGLF
jgi:hypothetical protein